MDYSIFKNKDLDRTKCPDNISLEILQKEMGKESQFYPKDLLWQIICNIMMDKDENGFYKE